MRVIAHPKFYAFQTLDIDIGNQYNKDAKWNERSRYSKVRAITK